ncbi:acyl-CoA ligase (AMP-forming), exosortase A system-associated [Thalassotalea ganghwensis]
MVTFVHQLYQTAVSEHPNKTALIYKDQYLTYREFDEQTKRFATNLSLLSIKTNERVGIFIDKNFEALTAIFGCSVAGTIFVPINHQLKTLQVKHIANDCNIKLLVTNQARLAQLNDTLEQFNDLTHVILIDGDIDESNIGKIKVLSWAHYFSLTATSPLTGPITGQDVAAIFYTSGSTGKAKGVVLSHSNIALGAQSVVTYLENNEDDVILAALPLSFDYGFNQITTSFLSNATCVLLNYLFPNDILRAVKRYQVTGLAGVPPLWHQLSRQDKLLNDGVSLRYFTNSGGALALPILDKLLSLLPTAKPYLMYGLTEAFRSTYLAPEKIDERKGSIGKAIPNANIIIARPDGSECDFEEEGEIVHMGPLVSLGYGNAPEKTAARFKINPKTLSGITIPQTAVWTGDYAKKDKDGYIYFVSRHDDMIKSSGYRVSPTEVEEVIFQLDTIHQAVCFGIPHPELGQAVIAIISPIPNSSETIFQEVKQHCLRNLPNYMVPQAFITLSELPLNANGKIDRQQLKATYQHHFSASENT